MSRQGSQYSTSSSSAAYRQTSLGSTGYNRTSRPPLPATNGTVASITKSLNTGGINIASAHTRARPSSRTSYAASPERQIRTTVTRRQPSQDRSNTVTDKIVDRYTGDREPSPTVTVYSLASAPEPTNSIQTESRRLSKVSSIDRRISQSSSAIDEAKLTQGGLCGLQNLGNTCFMNSVLQCLSNTKPLLLFCLRDDLDSLLNTSSTSVMKGVLMKEYASLIRKMWLLPEGRTIVSPSSFKNTIGKFAPRFTGYSEQDSQEFLRYLLQGLSEDVNRVREKPQPIKINEKEEEKLPEREQAKRSWDRCLRYENSPLVDIFAGQLKSTLECSYCQYKSITFDMFWDLSLPIPPNKSTTTLQECIQLFMSKEELDGNEKPMCAECKQKRPMTKKLSIQKCPEILVLHLKRFSQARGRTKLHTHVDFPITNLRLNGLINVMSESFEGPMPTYNLFGVSNHSGTVYTGHYVAQCKHPFTQQWNEFNDSSVHSINDTLRIVSADAYVLFYEQNRS